MLEQALTDIGLSPKEAMMYIALLRSGMQSTSVLARKAGFNRGTAYVVLHALAAKGLAVKTSRKKVQCFVPMDPQHLLRYLYHKEKDIQNQKLRVQAMMGKLTTLMNPFTAQPKIELLDGAEGARRVLDDTLNAQDKVLRSFLSIADIIDFVGGDFFDDYTDRRIAAGYSLLAIRTHEKDKRAFAMEPRSKRYITSAKERRDVRYAPEELAFPITIYLYDHKLGIISSPQENFALIIESKELADMQKELFELLWTSLPTTTKGGW